MQTPFCVTCTGMDDLQHGCTIPWAEERSDRDVHGVTLCRSCRDALEAWRLDWAIAERVSAAHRKRRAQAQDYAEGLRPILAGLADRSTTQIADELNRRQIPAPSGGRWFPMTVVRVLRRLGFEVRPRGAVARSA